MTPPHDDAPRGPGGRRALVGRRVFRSPLRRRIVFAVVFELLAILFTTLILRAVGNEGAASFAVAVVSSTVALIWNVVYNSLFERLERALGVHGRPWWARVGHTVGFEGGLVLFLVPAVALLLGVTLWEAFLIELGLIVFFLVYNAVYTYLFDAVFGLPDSAGVTAPGTP
ncbi:PACE efflux transporter [Micrococcus porci]|uniref:PACE efflux transporter n=1 Tax=Micrococcus TaxID=1269 RepID=UPI001CCA1C71|nr:MULTISPECIES: PACE efflux transporter [Micrococcus]MCG7421787.1 PACE efflux transporter [Micrococcus sp. ACRRV]UBH25766.1 PACE efflux transporter [Micrococcus porci]